MITAQNVEQVGAIDLKLMLFFENTILRTLHLIFWICKAFHHKMVKKRRYKEVLKITERFLPITTQQKSIFIELLLEFSKSKNRPTIRKNVEDGRKYI